MVFDFKGLKDVGKLAYQMPYVCFILSVEFGFGFVLIFDFTFFYFLFGFLLAFVECLSLSLCRMFLGYAYPAFECYKIVEKNRVEIEELRFWCQYWYVKSLSLISASYCETGFDQFIFMGFFS